MNNNSSYALAIMVIGFIVLAWIGLWAFIADSIQSATNSPLLAALCFMGSMCILLAAVVFVANTWWEDR